MWKLKRATVLQKAVTISCSQMYHLDVNNLVTDYPDGQARQPGGAAPDSGIFPTAGQHGEYDHQLCVGERFPGGDGDRVAGIKK